MQLSYDEAHVPHILDVFKLVSPPSSTETQLVIYTRQFKLMLSNDQLYRFQTSDL